MVTTRKFSEFSDAGDLDNSSITVGLKAGLNSQFDNLWTFLPSGTTAGRPLPASSIYYRLRFNTTTRFYEFYDAAAIPAAWVSLEEGGDVTTLIARLAAFTAANGASMIGLQNQTGVASKTVQDLANAGLIAKTDNGTLTNGQFLGALNTGILKSTNATGVLSISQPLSSIDNLTTAADKMIYTTSSNAYAVADLTPYARTLLDDANAATARSTLGLGTASIVNTPILVTNGGTGTSTAFTIGSVVFAGTSGVYTQDNVNLFWDNTNNRLGIGTPTPAVTLDIIGAVSASTFSGETIGRVNGGAVPAGDVGEIISATVAIGTPITLTTATTANVTSLALTAGEWVVYGQVGFNVAATTTISKIQAAINTTSATIPLFSTIAASAQKLETTFTTGKDQVLNAGCCSLNVAAPTTVYLIAEMDFAVDAAFAFGAIWARRSS